MKREKSVFFFFPRIRRKNQSLIHINKKKTEKFTLKLESFGRDEKNCTNGLNVNLHTREKNRRKEKYNKENEKKTNKTIGKEKKNIQAIKCVRTIHSHYGSFSFIGHLFSSSGFFLVFSFSFSSFCCYFSFGILFRSFFFLLLFLFLSVCYAVQIINVLCLYVLCIYTENEL